MLGDSNVLKRPLFKLWLLTAGVWFVLSFTTIREAYENRIFMASLRDPIYDDIVGLDPPPQLSALVRAYRYLADSFPERLPVWRLKIPYHCAAYEFTGPCFGNADKARLAIRSRLVEEAKRKGQEITDADYSDVFAYSDRRISIAGLNLWRSPSSLLVANSS
jgi:hypothetical protein